MLLRLCVHLHNVTPMLHSFQSYVHVQQEFEAAVRRNDITWHAFPFNAELEMYVAWDVLVGKPRCSVGGNMGDKGNSLLSNPKLFKHRPTLPHCPLKHSLNTWRC